MIVRRCPYSVGTVILSSTLFVGCGSNRPEPTPVAEAKPTVEAPIEAPVEVPVVKGTVAVHDSPQNLRFDVTFDVKSGHFFRGDARIERPKDVWPAAFEMRFRGRRFPIQLVTLNLDGIGPILLSNRDKKSVDFYDERGKRLDQPIENGITVETENTDEGLIAKVSLPEGVRSMRGMTIEYTTLVW